MVARAELPPHVEVHRHREPVARRGRGAGGARERDGAPALASGGHQPPGGRAVPRDDRGTGRRDRCVPHRVRPRVVERAPGARQPRDRHHHPESHVGLRPGQAAPATGGAEPRARAPEPGRAGVRPAPPVAADHGVGHHRPGEAHRGLPDHRRRVAAGRGRGAGGRPVARGSRAAHGSSRAREWCSSSRSSSRASCSGRASPTGCWPTRSSRRSASSRRRSSCSRRSSWRSRCSSASWRASPRRQGFPPCGRRRAVHGRGSAARCRSATAQDPSTRAACCPRRASIHGARACSARWRSPRWDCSRSSNRRAWRTCS